MKVALMQFTATADLLPGAVAIPNTLVNCRLGKGEMAWGQVNAITFQGWSWTNLQGP